MQTLHLVFQTLFLILAPAWRGAWNMEKSLMHNLEEIPSSLSSCQAESAGFSPLTHQGQQKGSLDHPHDESADSGSDCELGERCVGQSDENLSSWYVWFLVLCSLAVLLSCGMCCCLQCWLKRRSCLPRSTVAVFALSSSDAFGATEAPPCPFSGSLSPCRTAEISSSPAPCFSLGGTELPPSYEDVMKENKL